MVNIKRVILTFADGGLYLSMAFLTAYMLVAYPQATGIRIGQLILMGTDNTLYWISAIFGMLWFVSIFFNYSQSKICKKYGVAIVK